GHDLGERGLAEARGAGEQHVVECIAARLGGLDEHLEVGARLLLADELGEEAGPQRRLRVVRLAPAPRHESLVLGHGLLLALSAAGVKRKPPSPPPLSYPAARATTPPRLRQKQARQLNGR